MNNIKISMSPYVKYSKFWTTKKVSLLEVFLVIFVLDVR